MPDDLNIILEFKFQPNPRAVEITGRGVTDYIIRDIAFKAGELQRKNLSKNLRRDFAPIVERELSKMARQISLMAVGLSNSNKAPPGSLKIDGTIARAMQGSSGSMSIASVTGIWKERNKSYLRWKAKTYRTRRWFKNTGVLQSELRKVETYQQAYGPMGFKFVPVRSVAPTFTTLGRSRGRPSNSIVTGRFEVTVFKRLSLSDLPGIGEQARYSRRRLSGFADDIEKKLVGPDPEKKYRPIVEPFLTYYMNRKIPNAVFRKLEESILT